MATKSTGSSTRKKAAGSKGASTKAPSKRAPSKKAASEKAPSSRSADTGSEAELEQGSEQESEQESGGRKTASRSPSRRSAPKAESRPTPSATELARSAARDLLELTGKQPEGITGLERTDDGWTVQVEVVEVSRIPNTTDVLAVYEITTDDRGQLQGYRRLRRYARGVPGEE